jgi:hypothetical protein
VLDFESPIQGLLGVHSRYGLHTRAVTNSRPAIQETGGRLGFITPLTHNFCESCNRVRVTCTGTLYMCLGQEDAADLRAPLRLSEGNDLLEAAIVEAISRKPKGHDFIIDPPPPAPRARPAHECDRRIGLGPDFQAKVRIAEAEVFAGAIPSRHRREALCRISANREKLRKKWNEL